MKVNELISQLSMLDGELEMYVDVDGKIHGLDLVRRGPFFESASLVTRVEFDINRAEQTLQTLLEYHRDALEGVTLERIERALGHKRTSRIIQAFEEHEKKMASEREKNAEFVEAITESINRQDTYTNEPSVTSDSPEEILRKFYSGDKSHSLETVKEAKQELGEEKAAAIFNEVRNK